MCLFIYYWLHWVFLAACRLSLVAANGRLGVVHGLLLDSSYCRARTLGLVGFSSCSSPALEHGLSWSALCGILWTRDQIHVSCIGRQILNWWTIGKSKVIIFECKKFYPSFSRGE